MKKLFVYGTLMNEELIRALLRGSFPMVDAVLKGYERLQVVGQSYPAIRPNRHNIVKGRLMTKLSPLHIRKLDDYEGNMYKRISVRVITADSSEPIWCQTYVLKPLYYRRLANQR